MSNELSRAEVLRLSGEWVSPWYPPMARHLIVGDFEMYVQNDDATLMSHRGLRPGPDCIAAAVRAASLVGATTLTVTLGADVDDGHPSCETFTDSYGVDYVGSADVLALSLVDLDPTVIEVPPRIRVHQVQTAGRFAEYERTSARAWGYPPPDEATIHASFAKLEPGWFVAYRDLTPIGTGGYTLVDGAARLWGAAVVAAERGQGAYRGLVRTRLEDAAIRGASVALVHAERSSSPILRRLGFRKYGEHRTHRLRCEP